MSIDWTGQLRLLPLVEVNQANISLVVLDNFSVCGNSSEASFRSWIRCAAEVSPKQNVYSTMYSQAVTHPSTNMAQCCLTSVIRRELVFST